MATNNVINLNAAGITGYDGAGTFTGSAAAQYNVQVGGATTHQLASVAPSATSGVPLISQGASSNPVFGTAVVAGGGTGAATFNINGAVFSNTTTTGALASATLTSGQLLIGGTTTPAAATLTAGLGIAIANGNNSITITASGGGFTWTDVTGGSATVAAANGYLADKTTLTTFTLPTNNAIGDTIKIVGVGTGGWKIVYTTNQKIIFGTSTSTTTTGNVASTNTADCCTLVCTTASASAPIFTIVDAVGNLTVA
jgi:hypothetical protein